MFLFVAVADDELFERLGEERLFLFLLFLFLRLGRRQRRAGAVELVVAVALWDAFPGPHTVGDVFLRAPHGRDHDVHHVLVQVARRAGAGVKLDGAGPPCRRRRGGWRRKNVAVVPRRAARAHRGPAVALVPRPRDLLRAVPVVHVEVHHRHAPREPAAVAFQSVQRACERERG